MDQQGTARKVLPTSAAPPRSASMKTAPTLTSDGYSITCENMLAVALFGSQLETLKSASCPEKAIDLLKRRFDYMLKVYDVKNPPGKLRSFIPVVPWPMFALKTQCHALSGDEARLMIPPFMPITTLVETEPYFAVNLHIHRIQSFASLELEMEKVERERKAFSKPTRYLSVSAALAAFRAIPVLQSWGLYVPDGERHIIHSTRTSLQIVPVPANLKTPNHLLVLTAETFIPDGHTAR